jgi:hypothetical protein
LQVRSRHLPRLRFGFLVSSKRRGFAHAREDAADEMATKLAVVFYSDAKDALLKSVAD